MTQQEIQERNKQIALMLGYEISENKECFKLPNKNGWITLEVFYSDWNWLMQAVDFIENIYSYRVQIESKNCIVYKNSDVITQWYSTESKLMAVFIAVSDFAKLYNKKEL